MQRSELEADYWDDVVQRIFRLDDGIRYVGITDLAYHVMISKMRPGISSLTLTELDFLSIAPKIMGDSAQRLESNCGQLQMITARYGSVSVAIYRTSNYIVTLSFDPKIESPFLNKIATGLGSMMQ